MCRDHFGQAGRARYPVVGQDHRDPTWQHVIAGETHRKAEPRRRVLHGAHDLFGARARRGLLQGVGKVCFGLVVQPLTGRDIVADVPLDGRFGRMANEHGARDPGRARRVDIASWCAFLQCSGLAGTGGMSKNDTARRLRAGRRRKRTGIA